MIILSDNEAEYIKSLIKSLAKSTLSKTELDRCSIATSTLSRKSTPADAVRMWVSAYPQEAEVEIRRTA